MKCYICGESPPTPHPEGVSSWECKCKGLTVSITQRTRYEAEQHRAAFSDYVEAKIAGDLD